MAILEIIISAIGMLLIPVIISYYKLQKEKKQQFLIREEEKRDDFKKELRNEFLEVLKEHYYSLDALYDKNNMELIKLKERLNHRAEIAKLKYDDLWEKLECIESYLEQVNGYRRKKSKQLADPKVTGGDDLTGDLR
jgi:hypothetical protein